MHGSVQEGRAWPRAWRLHVMTDYSKPRREMVERLSSNAPFPPSAAVLSAMNEIPRHLFVEKPLWHRAYSDCSLPIGRGQTISQPATVLSMLSAVDPSPGSTMLEIGTGSGYLAAVASRICRKVYGLELMLDLVHHSRRVLLSLGITNVSISYGDGSDGWPRHAPYDCIVCSAGAPAVPQALFGQLAEGGRLGIPVGTRESQRFEVWTIERGAPRKLQQEFPCVFVPLTGRSGWNG